MKVFVTKKFSFTKIHLVFTTEKTVIITNEL